MDIPAFVETIWRDGTHDAINEAAGRPAGSLLNGYHFDFREDGSRRYLMGAEAPAGAAAPEGLAILPLPAQTYAVFESREPMEGEGEIGLEILNVWRRVYSEWFPSTQFEQVEGPCVEKYAWTDESRTESACEVWIPVRRRSGTCGV